MTHAHARRDLGFPLVVGAGQGLGLGDGFIRVCSGGGRVQLDRQQGPGGQFAGLLQSGEGLAAFRPRQGIEEAGDALLAHGVEGRTGLVELFCVGRRRHHGGQRLGGAVLANAVRVAGAVTSVLAVFGVGGVLVDPGQFQAARVGQHGVKIGGAHLDRTLGLECVQGRLVGVAVKPGHAHAVPAADFQPDIRSLVLLGIETGLDARLKLRAGHGLVFQVAQRHGAAAIAGMHVRIDKTGHQHAPGQVDQLCLFADVAVDPGIAADIDDLAARNGNGLLHGILAIDGVDVAIAHDRVGGRRAPCHAGKCRCRRNGDEQPGKSQMPHPCSYCFEAARTAAQALV
ncbi:hypothetical protein D9M73_151190 [compost metagenome]